MEINTEKLEILYSEEEIKKRVKELAEKIDKDYKDCKELMMIGVLKGSFIFMADLLRSMKSDVLCEFVKISSYGDSKKSSGKIDVNLDISNSKVEGKDVIIIEDIVDTGLSIKFLHEHIQTKSPRSVKICSLLLKEECLKEKVKVDYLGFNIKDLFVVGYGLDFAQKYRTLPYIAVHK